MQRPRPIHEELDSVNESAFNSEVHAQMPKNKEKFTHKTIETKPAVSSHIMDHIVNDDTGDDS